MQAALKRTTVRWCTGLVGAALIGYFAAGAAEAASCVTGAAADPAYPEIGQAPVIQAWVRDQPGSVPAPACDALGSVHFDVLVRVSGAFRGPGDTTAMLARLGAVSRLRDMSYWSFSRRQRETLVTEAYAVDSLEARRARPDFSAAELRAGKVLHFVQRDNRLSALVPFGLSLIAETDTRLQLRIDNVGPVKLGFVTLLGAREMQSSITVTRLGAGLWGYRSVTGLRQVRFGSLDKNRLSLASRATAMFDQLAGRVTEVEYLR